MRQRDKERMAAINAEWLKKEENQKLMKKSAEEKKH